MIRFLRRSPRLRTRVIAGFFAAAAAASSCGRPSGVLTQLVEARQVASDLHVQFTKAADAANRAVMADTDEASAVAAREAEQATQVVQRDADRLRSMLQALGYSAEVQHLDAFATRFAEYQTLDREILPLAVENTNLKAQRLAFGAAQQAADELRTALDDIARSATPKSGCCVEAPVARAIAAVSEIQVLEARHIPESDEAVMSRIEARMAAAEDAARKAMARVRDQARGAAAQVAAATAALDRLMSVNAEIVALSRRNSNVRSLALALGRHRTVAATCDDSLRALEEALGKHEFTATR